LLPLLLALLVAGCHRDGDCNPLVGDDCLTPFPSSFHLVSDPTSATGVRVHIGADALPRQAGGGGRIRPDRLDGLDGFSPATPFLVYFRRGVDATRLPGADDAARTLLPTSPVQIIDFASGARVPLMAELDARAHSNGRQALIIRPLERLRPATRYVVALIGLRDASGAPLVAAPFAALRDRAPLSAALAPLAPRYEEIFTLLAHAGVPRSALTLAWDVTTASDATATGHLLAMRDAALALLDDGKLSYAITATREPPRDPLLWREISATMKVPSFLSTDGATLARDGAGRPTVRALVDVPFFAHVPACARRATRPLPIVVIGPALLANARDTLNAPALERFANAYCSIVVATDWLGLATDDVGTLAAILPSDFNRIYTVTDRLQQAHVNAQVMTRMLLSRIKDDPALALDGRPLTDGSEVYYFGVSNGGIQGAAYLALSRDVTRGVLDVAGGEWSLMMFRCSDFRLLLHLMAAALPDPLDRQIAIAALQSEWDYTDAATFAPHLLAHPLPGAGPKQVLLQESLGDAEVTNVSTELLARAIGLPGLGLLRPVVGVAPAEPPLDSALTQWDLAPSPLPPTSDTALPRDNGAHTALYGYPVAQQQVMRFFRPDGRIVDVCHGRCTIGF
jgi:hypothetical protein